MSESQLGRASGSERATKPFYAVILYNFFRVALIHLSSSAALFSHSVAARRSTDTAALSFAAVSAQATKGALGAPVTVAAADKVAAELGAATSAAAAPSARSPCIDRREAAAGERCASAPEASGLLVTPGASTAAGRAPLAGSATSEIVARRSAVGGKTQMRASS